MDSKERIDLVVAGKIPDKIPYCIELTKKGKENFARDYEIPVESIERFIDNDLLYVNFSHPENFTPEKLQNGKIRDEFGVTWDMEKASNIGDWGMVDHPVKDLSLEGYNFPSAAGKGRFNETGKIVRKNPGKFNLLQMVGIFEIPTRFAGMENIMVAIGSDEDFAFKCFDMALEFNLGILGQIPDYIHGVRFIEDWGDQRGLMMGVEYWRKYLKPRLRIMYEECRNKGCAVSIHSCGNITELIPELIEIGVDIIDPIQPEVMDLHFIKKEYGKDVVLFGGIGTQSTLPLCTPEQVIEEAKNLLSFMSVGGNFIMGPSGAVTVDTPSENIAALIEFCRSVR